MPTDRRAHWETVYATKDDTAVSWFQEAPTPSLPLITSIAGQGARVVDIGGGASRLAEQLLAAGYRVTVLDIADAPLAKARARMGAPANRIDWVVADVTTWKPRDDFDVWHDRAVFHFLVDADDRRKYANVALQAVRRDGYLVIGTFAPDGPDRCSGLPVCRYDAAGIEAELGPGFALVDQRRAEHRTPGGAIQHFVFAVLRRHTGRGRQAAGDGS